MQRPVNDGRHLSILIAGGTRVVPISLDLRFECLIWRATVKNIVAFLEAGLSQECFPA
jgi:hypothetical protein